MAGLTHRVLTLRARCREVLPQGMEALQAENVVRLSGLLCAEAEIDPAE